jgi:hypothetical protein
MPVESVPEEGPQTNEGEDEVARASQPTGTFKPRSPPGSTGSASAALLQASAATKELSPSQVILSPLGLVLHRPLAQVPLFVDKQEYVEGALRAPYFDAWGRPVAFGGGGGGGDGDGGQHGQGGQGGVAYEAYEAYEPYQLREQSKQPPIYYPSLHDYGAQGTLHVGMQDMSQPLQVGMQDMSQPPFGAPIQGHFLPLSLVVCPRLSVLVCERPRQVTPRLCV